MAEVGIPLVRTRVERAKVAGTERFLTRPRVAGLVVFVLFGLTFDDGRVQDDGTVYFNFMRKLLGAHTEAVAYQFGNTFWNAPFYLISQLVALRGGFDRFHAGEVGVNLASNAAVLITLYLGWRI